MRLKLNELLYQVSFALDCVERDLVGVASGHSKRVACLCMELGARMGLARPALADLASCAVLHDNALTEYLLSEQEERASQGDKGFLGRHCILGEENARAFPFLEDVEGVILYHHENADGSSCFGKTRSQVPLGAALLRLADHVDVLFKLGTLNTARLRDAAGHVRAARNKLYDPDVANAFLELAQQGNLDFLADGQIDSSLQERTPQTAVVYNNQELLRIARVFAKIIDYKSPFTRRHSLGIANKAAQMAAYYGKDEDETTLLVFAAALHDLGKLTTNSRILEKPGKLTPEEYKHIQQHVRYTYQMLDGISGLELVNSWASAHHEKLDGSGYPFGKTAEQLDFNARLLGCIDIYQALTEERPYRSGMSHAQAIQLLYESAQAGKLDGEIVRDMEKTLGDEPYQMDENPWFLYADHPKQLASALNKE